MGVNCGGQSTICRICRTRVTRLPKGSSSKKGLERFYRRTCPQGARQRAMALVKKDGKMWGRWPERRGFRARWPPHAV